MRVPRRAGTAPAPPTCTRAEPAPRVTPWDLGGVRSDDGWNRGYAHPLADVVPDDVQGINWATRCPACGTSTRTTFGTAADAAFPDAGGTAP